jgi:two-component system, LuxR family, response regulator FixJ
MMSRDNRELIHIVDDDDSARKSLIRLLESVGYRAEAFSSAKEYLETEPGEVPACLIVDMRMPGMSGLELQQALNDTQPSLSIIFLTGFGTIPASVKAIQAGAVDFIEKPFDEQTLLESINRGITLYQSNRDRLRELRFNQACFEKLTLREREVFALVVTGILNKQIADRLDISEKTVKIHRARVFEKMQADSLPALVRMADLLGSTSDG